MKKNKHADLKYELGSVLANAGISFCTSVDKNHHINSIKFNKVLTEYTNLIIFRIKKRLGIE